MPITAWLPFSIAVFGIYDASALFLIGLGAFYPIVVNTTHGVRDTNLLLLRAARMMGARRGRPCWPRWCFPRRCRRSSPACGSGIGVAWTAVIVAEMIAVKSGLGYVLWDAYYVGRMDICVATMFSVGLLGFLSDRLIVSASRLRAALAHARGRTAMMADGRARGVSKEFVERGRRVVALQDIDLAIARGRVRRASSAPRAAASRPCSTWWPASTSRRGGSVRVDGAPIREPRPAAARVVFQEPALFPWYTRDGTT